MVFYETEVDGIPWNSMEFHRRNLMEFGFNRGIFTWVKLPAPFVHTYNILYLLQLTFRTRRWSHKKKKHQKKNNRKIKKILQSAEYWKYYLEHF
jgi:hypothetical protein